MIKAFITDVSSAQSMPEEEGVWKRPVEVQVVTIESFYASRVSSPLKRIIVRGPDVYTVRLSYDLLKEEAEQRNLLANKGQEVVFDSQSEIPAV